MTKMQQSVVNDQKIYGMPAMPLPQQAITDAWTLDSQMNKITDSSGRLHVCLFHLWAGRGIKKLITDNQCLQQDIN